MTTAIRTFQEWLDSTTTSSPEQYAVELTNFKKFTNSNFKNSTNSDEMQTTKSSRMEWNYGQKSALIQFWKNNKDNVASSISNNI